MKKSSLGLIAACTFPLLIAGGTLVKAKAKIKKEQVEEVLRWGVPKHDARKITEEPYGSSISSSLPVDSASVIEKNHKLSQMPEGQKLVDSLAESILALNTPIGRITDIQDIAILNAKQVTVKNGSKKYMIRVLHPGKSGVKLEITAWDIGGSGLKFADGHSGRRGAFGPAEEVNLPMDGIVDEGSGSDSQDKYIACLQELHKIFREDLPSQK